MCQLSLIDFRKRKFNALASLTMSQLNSKTNADGTGIFNPDHGIWKTRLAAHLCLDLGKFINIYSSNEPSIVHVRKASDTTKKGVDDRFSHPFGTNNLILAHNGTLSPKVGEIPEDKIDSQFFLEKVDEIYEQTKDLPESLKSAMDQFYGKFAFLMYEVPQKKFYVVRGSAAQLHYLKVTQKGEHVGTIINTDKYTLLEGYLYINCYFQALFGIELDYITKDDVVEIKRETIFEYNDGELKEVGEIKENYKPYVPAKSESSFGGMENSRIPLGNGKIMTNSTMIDSLSDEAKLVKEFMDKFGVGFPYVDEICYQAMGISFLELNEDALALFMKVLKKVMDESRYRENVIKEWKKIMDRAVAKGYNTIQTHTRYNIPFPYMLGSILNLRDAKRAMDRND